MSRPWELCRVCSLISRISFRSRSKAGEIKFFLTSGPAVGDGERVYKCSPGAPAASRAPAEPCRGAGAPEAAGPSGPSAGRRRRRRRQIPLCLLPGRGNHLRGGLSPGGGAVPTGGATEVGRTRPPRARGDRGGYRPGSLPDDGSPSLQQALMAKGQLKAKRGKVINGPFAFKRGPGPGFLRLRVSHQEKGWRGER